MDFLWTDAQISRAVGEAIHVARQQIALRLGSAGQQVLCDVCSIPLPALEKSFVGQTFVDMQDRVLINGQFLGQLPNACSRSPGTSTPLTL